MFAEQIVCGCLRVSAAKNYYKMKVAGVFLP
jgi:hypothetical protein